MQVSVLNIVRRGGGGSSSFLLFPRVCSSFCVLSASPVLSVRWRPSCTAEFSSFSFLLQPPDPFPLNLLLSFPFPFFPLPSLPHTAEKGGGVDEVKFFHKSFFHFPSPFSERRPIWEMPLPARL